MKAEATIIRAASEALEADGKSLLWENLYHKPLSPQLTCRSCQMGLFSCNIIPAHGEISCRTFLLRYRPKELDIGNASYIIISSKVEMLKMMLRLDVKSTNSVVCVKYQGAW